MAVPKRKTSPSRRGMRRSHIRGMKLINLAIDPVTGDYKLSHHISKLDGTYKVKMTKNEKGKKSYKNQQVVQMKNTDES